MTLSKGRTGSHSQCARERFEFKKLLGSFTNGAILPLLSPFAGSIVTTFEMVGMRADQLFRVVDTV